ncbi:MAG: rRNA maturation RNase YbeY [Bacteroidales bacterium]
MLILIHNNHPELQPPQEQRLVDFLELLLKNEDHNPGAINIVYITNQEILELNKKYLDHNYFTDVLAFRYNEGSTIDGDIFISLDKVKENALDYNTEFYNECLRVVIHGLLHLTGYTDSTETTRKHMHELEDHYLHAFFSKKE